MTTRFFFGFFAVFTLVLAAHAQKFQHVFDVNAITPRLTDASADIRQQAVQQLGIIGDPAATEALLPLLQDDSAEVRRDVVKSLTALRDARAIQALSEAYRTDDMLPLQPQIITAVGNTCDEKAIPLLISALKDTDPLIRDAVLKAIKNFYDPRINDAVQPLLTGDDKAEKLVAIEILSRAHDPRGLDGMITMLADADDAIRLAATTAMVCYRNSKAVPALIKVLQDDKVLPIRTQAAMALGVTKDTRAVEPLLAILRDNQLRPNSPQVRFLDAVLFALGSIGDERALQLLMNFYNIDKSSVLRYNAAQKNAWALQQFGDKGLNPIIDILKQGTASKNYDSIMWSLPIFDDSRLYSAAIDKKNRAEYENYLFSLTAPRSLRGGAGYGLISSDKWYIAFRANEFPRVSTYHNPQLESAIIDRLNAGMDSAALAVRYRTPEILELLLKKAELKFNGMEKRALFRALGCYNDERIVPVVISMLDDQFTVDDLRDAFFAPFRDQFWGSDDVHDLIPLLTLLKDKDKEVRKTGAMALAIIGDARAVQPLIDVFTTDKEADVREYVVDALGIIGDKRALPALNKASTDPVERARSAAQWAIGEIGDPDYKDILYNSGPDDNTERPALAPGAKYKSTALDDKRHYTIGKSLLQMGDIRGTDFLAQALKSTDGMAQMLAVHGLSYGKLPVSHAILRSAFGNYATADQALKEICADPQPGDAPALLEMLNGIYRVYTRLIADALGKTGDKRAIPALHSIMVNSTMDDEIIAAAGALIKLGEEREAVPVLLGKLANFNKDNLNSVIIALAEAKDTAIIEPLAGKLTDDDPLTVAIAARALALHGDKRGNEAILRVLNMDEEELVLRAVAKFAGEVKDPRFVAPLVKLTQTGKLYVRLEAADALGKIGGKDAVADLIAMLKEERSRLREAGALGLMAAKDKSAIPALKALQKDETATKVQDAIAAALKVIG